MRIQLKYPAFVTGKTSRMKTNRHFVCLPEIDFEITEADEYSFQSALSVADGNGKIIETYASDGTDLYECLGSVKKVFSDTNLSNPLTDRNPLFVNYNTYMRRDFINVADFETLHPKNIHVLLSYHDINANELKNAVSIIDKIVPTSQTEADFSFWERKTIDILSDLVVSDGKIWKKHPDLCYQVNAREKTLSIRNIRFYEEDIRDRKFNTDWLSLSYRYFSLQDYDDAVEYLNSVSGSYSAIENKVIFHTEIDLQSDIRKLELLRLAQVCFYEFDMHVWQEMARNPMALETLPTGLVVACSGINEELFSKTEPDEQRLQEYIEDFAINLDVDDEWVETFKMNTEIDSIQIGQMIERWRDRVIGIPSLRI